MDRITKAIELARERNEQKTGQSAPASTRRQRVADVELDKVRKVNVSADLLKNNGIISNSDDGRFSDSYRLLRTRVLQRMRQNSWKTLGITSSHPKAGKSYTSINLGIAIAMDQNHSTLLVDADMRRPSVHNYFGLNPDIGIADYLQRDIPLTDVMLDPGISDFRFIPCAQSIDGTSELLGGPKMAQLIETMKKDKTSQIGVFDLPPILVGDDVVTLTSQLDAVLVVVEDGVTQSDELLDAMELLRDMNVIGTILNKATDTDMHQYGGYY